MLLPHIMKAGLIKLIQGDKHPAPPGHPENSERMSWAVEDVLQSDIGHDIDTIEPKFCDTDCIARVHDQEYLDQVRRLSNSGGGYLDEDTFATKDSFEAAWNTALASTHAAGIILSGEYNRIFIAGRPPGHHAERNRAMGFCIINNVAVAAESFIYYHNIKRLAIIDWDVHHGNGTQNIFYDRADVLYISMHQYPLYPGTGAESETGVGEGDGYTLNIPLPPGGDDELYIDTFREKIIPALSTYKPEIVIISCGFDAHFDDPLAGMKLSETAYGAMTAMLVDVSKEYCNDRILSLFEGGYDRAANARCLYYHIKELQRN